MPDEQAQPIPSGERKPLIFISHDSRDAALAEAFSKLLSSVSAGVLKSFRSSDKKGTQGIEYGVEWFPEIMSKLESASDVVCLLTPNSVGRPWILYEAGVARGKLNTPVHGVALGIPLEEASTGPFAQFQNCDDDDESLASLVMQLVGRIPNSEPDRDIIVGQVISFKAGIESAHSAAEQPKAKTQKQVDSSATAKLFEEIKVMFQDLPSRIENRLCQSVDFQDNRRRYRRFHPMMLEEILHGVVIDKYPFLPLVIFLSYIRNDLPWLYEIGMQINIAAEGNDWEKVGKLSKMLVASLRIIKSSPISELTNSDDLFVILKDLPRIIDRFMRRAKRAEQQVLIENENDLNAQCET